MPERSCLQSSGSEEIFEMKNMCKIIIVFLSIIFISACAAGPEPMGERIIEMNIKAWQWGYSPNLIRVREGDILRLNIISLDVEHSLTCPELGVDFAIPPRGSEPVHLEFQARARGDYLFHCNKPCGPGKERMHLRLIVMP